MAQPYSGKTQKILTIFLCFWVAFFEGFDLQAPGVAAKGIAASFGLGQVQMGYVFRLFWSFGFERGTEGNRLKCFRWLFGSDW